MEKVRCKFTCTKAQKVGEGIDLRFEAVTCGSPENERFNMYTPNGTLEFSTTNPEITGRFVEGSEYYLDITSAR